MREVLVLFATREGQTRKIAEYVAWRLRRSGLSVQLHDVDSVSPDFSVAGFDAAILAASVHRGKHEREMIIFAKANRADLERIPSAFLSVSLTEAGAENTERGEAERAIAQRDVEKLIDDFREETHWNPEHVEPVAGALLYRKYGWFVRLLMKRIARTIGGPTDTTEDHELTDWTAVDRFTEAFAHHVLDA